jgi:hypothetical protein
MSEVHPLFQLPSVFGARWFITFIDDCTLVTWLFLIKNKSEVSTILPNVFSMIKNQFGANIKLDPIIHESSCVKTPQQNGIAERKNGHLLDQTRALLFQNNVPKYL